MIAQDIYTYIKEEESDFETEQIQIGDNWWWNFRNHVQMIFHLKNGQFFTGANDWLRPFKAVMEPLLELAYWTEDIDVKDVVFFTEGDLDKVYSFLIKKYYDEVYVREHDLDEMFDEITESDLDYGGVLVQETKSRPEVLPLNAVAFCDQTNVEGGPIGFKHNFSPDKLLSMKGRGWGDEANGATISLEDLVTLASFSKDAEGTRGEQKNATPGKTVEVYIVRGDLPEAYLKGNNNFDTYCKQVQVVAFYKDEKDERQGVTLYRKKDYSKGLLFFTSKKVHGRGLGRGVGERLLGDQIWTNFLTIHKTSMLEAGSKVPLVTDDETYTQKNKIQEMENLEVTTIGEGKEIKLVPTISPLNVQLFDKAIDDWYAQAQLDGAAFDPILGKEPPSGTTFKGQERTVAQGRGIHDRRRGQRAKFIELIHREYILPKIATEIAKGQEFLATLTVDEMQWVADRVATGEANRRIKKAMIEEGRIISNEERDLIVQTIKQSFGKDGNRKLIKIMKDELKDVPIRMGINVAGKQKDLVTLSDKLLSIFQFVFSNPAGFQQAMQNPALARAFGDILEFSGMSVAQFSSLLAPMQQTALPQPAGQPAPSPALMAQPQAA